MALFYHGNEGNQVVITDYFLLYTISYQLFMSNLLRGNPIDVKNTQQVLSYRL